MMLTFLIALHDYSHYVHHKRRCRVNVLVSNNVFVSCIPLHCQSHYFSCFIFSWYHVLIWEYWNKLLLLLLLFGRNPRRYVNDYRESWFISYTHNGDFNQLSLSWSQSISADALIKEDPSMPTTTSFLIFLTIQHTDKLQEKSTS